MNQPRPDTVRVMLEGVLGKATLRASALKSALTEEREALVGRDPERLDVAVNSKQSLVRDLDGLERSRVAICSDAGFGEDSVDMVKLIAWCDADTTLGQGWNQLLELGADCDRLNLANGAIIRLRQQQISDGLLVLRGTALETNTYGPTGATDTTPGGRTLTEA